MNNNVAATARDFGILTSMSKDVNQMFGDDSGRTVSNRTSQGFKDAFNLSNMQDNDAEDLVHGLMILTPVLLSQKSETANAIGILLLASLIGSYLNGK